MNLTLIESGITRLGIHPVSGLPISLKNTRSGMEYLKNIPQPFFRLNGIICGEEVCLTAADAISAGIFRDEDGGLTLYYNFLGEYDVCVRCGISRGEDGLLCFDITVQQQAMEVCTVEYPLFLIRDSLDGSGEDWVLEMNPTAGGMLIHGFENAQKSAPLAISGVTAFSPAQLGACGCASEQLYMTTRDVNHCGRQLIPTYRDGSLHMSALYIPDDRFAEEITMPYRAAAGILPDGEWYAAAEMFRKWSNAQFWAEKRLTEREDVPAWWLNSPVVVAIKERGKRNGEPVQKPSGWCHPLTKGVPRILEIAGELDSPVNVQVFHWEKGGAFVNGDHFPPLSGFDGTAEFFRQLHENGHTGGVYIIPHFWTFKADTTGFDASPFMFAHHAAKNAVLGKDGKPALSPWDRKWRKRVRVCVTEDEPRRELVESFRKFSDMGADYIQFDTFYGALPACYNPNHRHPSGGGSWQVGETLSLIRELRSFPQDFVLTYECQPLPEVIPLSHGFVERGIHPLNWKGGEMIPLYQFLYHPYIQGFAGENCGDFSTPDNFFYLNAVTWVSGDLTMISLDMRGDVCMQTHEIDAYDQTVNSMFSDAEIFAFLRRINRLRRGAAKKYLSEGEMLRPPKITCEVSGALAGDGFIRDIPAVLGSAWQAADGARGAVFVNHTDKDREIVADLRCGGETTAATLVTDQGTSSPLTLQDGTAKLTVRARGAVLIEY